MSLNEHELEREIDRLFEKADKEQFVHSRSERTFDALAGLWRLGPKFEQALAHLSGNYIVSSFLLDALALVYERARTDYNIPEFGALHLMNSTSVTDFEQALERLKGDAIFVDWMENILLPKCEELLRRVNTHDLAAVASLGNLADSTQHVAEHSYKHDHSAGWIYDSVFQFYDAAVNVSAETYVPELTSIQNFAFIDNDSHKFEIPLVYERTMASGELDLFYGISDPMPLVNTYKPLVNTQASPDVTIWQRSGSDTAKERKVRQAA